jgi:hypothetical protein
MNPIYSRLFLLVLLVGDWAWDVHFGADAFCRPMCSTNVTCCTSIARPTPRCDGDGASPLLLLSPLTLRLHLIAPDQFSLGTFHACFSSFHSDPLYVFMSLSC